MPNTETKSLKIVNFTSNAAMHSELIMAAAKGNPSFLNWDKNDDSRGDWKYRTDDELNRPYNSADAQTSLFISQDELDNAVIDIKVPWKEVRSLSSPYKYTQQIDDVQSPTELLGSKDLGPSCLICGLLTEAGFEAIVSAAESGAGMLELNDKHVEDYQATLGCLREHENARLSLFAPAVTSRWGDWHYGLFIDVVAKEIDSDKWRILANVDFKIPASLSDLYDYTQKELIEHSILFDMSIGCLYNLSDINNWLILAKASAASQGLIDFYSSAALEMSDSVCMSTREDAVIGIDTQNWIFWTANTEKDITDADYSIMKSVLVSEGEIWIYFAPGKNFYGAGTSGMTNYVILFTHLQIVDQHDVITEIRKAAHVLPQYCVLSKKDTSQDTLEHYTLWKIHRDEFLLTIHLKAAQCPDEALAFKEDDKQIWYCATETDGWKMYDLSDYE